MSVSVNVSMESGWLWPKTKFNSKSTTATTGTIKKNKPVIIHSYKYSMSAHSCPVNFVNILKLLFRFFASRSLNTKLNMLLFSWFQSNQVQTANLLPILFIYIKSLLSSRRVKLRILRLQFVYPKMAYCITSL